jgi:hypothetical protein
MTDMKIRLVLPAALTLLALSQPALSQSDPARCIEVEPLPPEKRTALGPECVSRESNVCMDRLHRVRVTNRCDSLKKVEVIMGGKARTYALGRRMSTVYSCLQIQDKCQEINVLGIWGRGSSLPPPPRDFSERTKQAAARNSAASAQNRFEQIQDHVRRGPSAPPRRSPWPETDKPQYNDNNPSLHAAPSPPRTKLTGYSYRFSYGMLRTSSTCVSGHIQNLCDNQCGSGPVTDFVVRCYAACFEPRVTPAEASCLLERGRRYEMQ